jgi:hypothetical protein
VKDTLNSQNAEPHLYSFADAARKLGSVSVYTIHKHAAKGSIAVIRIGRRVFLSAREVARISKEGLPSLTTNGR